MNYGVILFEKEQYPFHRVCGEYISMESWDFLQGLGVDLRALNVSMITQLQVSAVNGKLLKQRLPLGGFGISRYRLDHELAEIARKTGVTIVENAKVNEVFLRGLEFNMEASGQRYKAEVACASYGKRSNLDIRWKRPFITATKNKLNNYVGIKYHIRSSFPADTIALHNFENGYCGIVKIEDDKYNLCYLTTATNLQACNGMIPEMEQHILAVNPHLRKIFEESERITETPLTISQISFDKKSQVEDHVLMIGDAAGMITPLCGNGMSMALHGSKIATACIDMFFRGQLSREEMEDEYEKRWQRQFAGRLRAGRRIQRMFGSKWLTNTMIGLAKPFPGLINSLVKQTHGQPF